MKQKNDGEEKVQSPSSGAGVLPRWLPLVTLAKPFLGAYNRFADIIVMRQGHNVKQPCLDLISGLKLIVFIIFQSVHSFASLKLGECSRRGKTLSQPVLTKFLIV